MFFISAVSGEGIEPLLGQVVETLETLPKDEPSPYGEQVAQSAPNRRRPAAAPNTFRKENGVYIIHSEQLERLSALADTRDYRVLLQLWREMTRLGIALRLEEAGIEPGDTIRIGRAEMEWF